MAYDFIDLNKSASAPGVGSIAYLAPMSWIETFATISGTGPGASVVYNTAHVMATGKGFIQFYTTQEFSDFAGTTTGDADSETMEYTINLQNPNIRPETAEFIKNARTEKWVIILKPASCQDGLPYHFGTHCSPVQLSFEVNSGQVNSGSNAVKAIGKWYHPYPLFYSAAIPLLEPEEEEGG